MLIAHDMNLAFNYTNYLTHMPLQAFSIQYHMHRIPQRLKYMLVSKFKKTPQTSSRNEKVSSAPDIISDNLE